MRNYVITTDAEVINDAGDTLQVVLTCPTDLPGSGDIAVDARDNGISVKSWGELEWSYDIDDALLAPSSIRMEFNDAQGYLDNILFGAAWILVHRDEITIEIKKNSATEFTGTIIEDSPYSNPALKYCRMGFDPGIKALTTEALYAEEFGVEYAITNAVHDAGIVTVTTQEDHTLTASCVVSIWNIVGMTDLNSDFRIVSIPETNQFTVNLTTSQTYDSGGSVEQKEARDPLNLTDVVPYSVAVTELLEKIFQLVNPSISYSSGDITITHNWLMWGDRFNTTYPPLYDGHKIYDITFAELLFDKRPMFFDSTKNLNTVADVLRKLSIDWCAFSGMIHSKKAFFKKLFYYDAVNAQTLPRVLRFEEGYSGGVIDYVKIVTIWNAVSKQWTKGNNPFLEERKIVRDTLITFWSDGDAGSPPAEYPNSKSSVLATIARTPNTDDGSYAVWGVSDPDYFSAAFVPNGKLIAEYWYDKRGTMTGCRRDRFDLLGIAFDPMKDFLYDGRMYQPIMAKKYLSKNHTEVEALYLGEVGP